MGVGEKERRKQNKNAARRDAIVSTPLFSSPSSALLSSASKLKTITHPALGLLRVQLGDLLGKFGGLLRRVLHGRGLPGLSSLGFSSLALLGVDLNTLNLASLSRGFAGAALLGCVDLRALGRLQGLAGLVSLAGFDLVGLFWRKFGSGKREGGKRERFGVGGEAGKTSLSLSLALLPCF